MSDDHLTTRQRVQKFMLTHMDAEGMAFLWECPGPKNTMIEAIQCWRVPSIGDKGKPQSRLLMVQVYKQRNGFNVFPETMTNRLDETAAVIGTMDIIEAGVRAMRPPFSED